jgi:hypothetical protein
VTAGQCFYWRWRNPTQTPREPEKGAKAVQRKEDHRDFEGARGWGAVVNLCRKHGISNVSLYGWKAKYCGMDVSDAKKLKSLEHENGKLIITSG